MTTKEFVKWALKERQLTKYRLAVSLDLAPVSINQYLRGTRMSTSTTKKVLQVYGVTVTDSFER